jgi:hypothetical protein
MNAFRAVICRIIYNVRCLGWLVGGNNKHDSALPEGASLPLISAILVLYEMLITLKRNAFCETNNLKKFGCVLKVKGLMVIVRLFNEALTQDRRR